jgi:hypothetical protein
MNMNTGCSIALGQTGFAAPDQAVTTGRRGVETDPGAVKSHGHTAIDWFRERARRPSTPRPDLPTSRPIRPAAPGIEAVASYRSRSWAAPFDPVSFFAPRAAVRERERTRAAVLAKSCDSPDCAT